MLVDIPKDVQQQLAVPDWTVPMALSGYMSRLPLPPTPADMMPVIAAIREVCLALGRFLDACFWVCKGCLSCGMLHVCFSWR